MSKQKRFLLILIIALLVGAGWYYYNTKQSGQSADSAMAPQQRVAQVDVIELASSEIMLKKTLPGRITPFKQSEIRPQVNGIITERLFEEGSNVEKGQQLYQIDDTPFKAMLTSAQADLMSAKASLTAIQAKTKRFESLVKINAVSQQEYDDVVAQLNQANASIAVAQSSVSMAEVDLNYTKVYAPISGRIGRSMVSEGALVTSNQPQNLSIITQLDPVYVDMTQSSSDAMNLRSQLAGKDNVPVEVIIKDVVGVEPSIGTLKFSEVTVDQSTDAIGLRAIIPNAENALLPGLFVQSVINIGEKQVVLVPQRATTRDANGDLGLWIVDAENKAQPVIISVEDSYEDQWIIREGVKAGDTIIIEGYQKLSPGMQVESSPWASKNDNSADKTN